MLETIAVASRSQKVKCGAWERFPNRAESIRKLIKKLGPAGKLRACYEAGPTGYVVYWQLAELGVECEVVAPTPVPVKAGDRVSRRIGAMQRSWHVAIDARWRDDRRLLSVRGSSTVRVGSRCAKVPRHCAILCVPAKQPSRIILRARHRLSRPFYAPASVHRPELGPWTRPYLIWVAQLRFTQIGLPRVHTPGLSARGRAHAGTGCAWLEQAIMEAVKLALAGAATSQ